MHRISRRRPRTLEGLAVGLWMLLTICTDVESVSQTTVASDRRVLKCIRAERIDFSHSQQSISTLHSLVPDDYEYYEDLNPLFHSTGRKKKARKHSYMDYRGCKSSSFLSDCKVDLVILRECPTKDLNFNYTVTTTGVANLTVYVSGKAKEKVYPAGSLHTLKTKTHRGSDSYILFDRFTDEQVKEVRAFNLSINLDLCCNVYVKEARTTTASPSLITNAGQCGKETEVPQGPTSSNYTLSSPAVNPSPITSTSRPDTKSTHTSTPAAKSTSTSTPDSKSTHTSRPDSKSTHTSSPDSKSTHTSTPDSKSTHTSRPDTKSTHTSTPDTKSTHSSRPDSKSTHTTRPDTKSTHSSTPDSKSTHTSTPDSKSTHSTEMSTDSTSAATKTKFSSTTSSSSISSSLDSTTEPFTGCHMLKNYHVRMSESNNFEGNTAPHSLSHHNDVMCPTGDVTCLQQRDLATNHYDLDCGRDHKICNLTISLRQPCGGIGVPVVPPGVGRWYLSNVRIKSSALLRLSVRVKQFTEANQAVYVNEDQRPQLRSSRRQTLTIDRLDRVDQLYVRYTMAAPRQYSLDVIMDACCKPGK